MLKTHVKWLSHVQLFATPWTVACQPPPSMGFSRQEYWSGLPFLSPTYLPDPGIEPRSPALQADFIVWATEESICQNPYINIMDQLHLFHLVAYSLPHHKQRMDTQLLRKYLSGCQTIPKLFLFVPLCAPHLYKMLRKPEGSCLWCLQASKAIVVSSQEYANSHPSLLSNLN